MMMVISNVCSVTYIHSKIQLLINSVHVKILLGLDKKDCNCLLCEVTAGQVFLPKTPWAL